MVIKFKPNKVPFISLSGNNLVYSRIRKRLKPLNNPLYDIKLN